MNWDEETQKNAEKLRKMQQGNHELPKTNQELFSRLKQAGIQKRKEKEYTITKGANQGKVVRPRLTFREITDIVKKYAIFRTIGENAKELEVSPLYWYDLDNGTYTKNTKKIDAMINVVDNQTKDREIKEIRQKIRIECKEAAKTSGNNLIIVNNGVYDRKQNKLLPFSPKYIFTTKIATNYNPNASQEPVYNGWSVSQWFADIADGKADKLKLLWQIITASIDSNISHEAAIFLVDDGQGRTGKSTFEKLIMNLVGEENCGQLKLIEFENDFKLAGVDEKAIIIGDDNDPNTFNENSSNFKSLVTGETMIINPKGMPLYYNRFNSLILQSMNGVPRFKDSTDAHLRRFRVVKFNHQYKATPENRKIKDDYINRKALLEWLLYKALHSEPVTTFIQTNESKDATQEIKEDNDAVYYFINKYLDELESTRIPVKFLFNYFLACMDAENNPQKIKQNTFTKKAKKIMTAKGWHYSRKNLMPSDYFKKSDIKKLDNTDINYKYRFNYDDNYHKQQPLFEKESDK